MTYYQECLQKCAELRNKKSGVRILAIESSCDESAAAVVRDGRVIESSAVYSQIDLHALYGGVVPEIASRSHVMKVDLMAEKALEEAGVETKLNVVKGSYHNFDSDLTSPLVKRTIEKRICVAERMLKS